MGLYKKGIEKTISSEKEKDGSLGKEKVGSSLKTGIDKFYHLIEVSTGGITFLQIHSIIDSTPEQIEDWGNILERQGLIKVEYTSTGTAVYKPIVDTTSQYKETLILRKKRYIFFGLLLLFLGVIILIYLLGVFL